MTHPDTDAASSSVGARSSHDVVIAACAVAAFGAGFSGVAPTGTSWWDPLLGITMAVMFVLASSRADIWALVFGLTVATLFVGVTPWAIVVVAGWAALVASIGQPRYRRDLSAVAGAFIVLGLLHLSDIGFFGFTAFAAGLAVVVVCLNAYRTLAGASRAIVRRVLLWGTVLVAVVLGLAAVQALLARGAANAGVEAARSGINAARAGETQELSTQLERAQVELSKANDAVTSPLLRPVALIPVAAQHLRSVQTATTQGLAVANEARSASEEANLDELQMRQGQFDLDLLTSMAPRLESAATSLRAAVNAIEADRSGWLLPVVDDRLQSLVDEVNNVLPEAEVAAQAARVMPTLLGADGERRYLLLFGSPGEAREFGGFVGGYAVIGIDNGDLNLVQAGSVNDIVPIANLGELEDPLSYPVEYRSANPAMFPQNLTSTPSLRLIAQAVQDIFPELLGAPIDGVIYLDPYALAAMTEITGPVSVEGIGDQLIGDDITNFIFDGQYRLFDGRAERFEAIGALAEATAAAFAAADLPGPETLGRLLGPVARAGRLQVITYDEAENDFLTAVRLQRHFSAPSTIDAFAVVHTNASLSKLDLFIERQIRYDVTVVGEELQAIVDVELRSAIPPDVPELTYGFTDGTNQVLLSLYSPHELTDLTVDGEAHEFVVHQEFGFFRYALFTIPLPPNATVDVQFRLVGTAPDEPYRVGVWQQPTVNLDTVEIVYRVPGQEPISVSQELVEGWLFDPLAAIDDE